MWRSKRERLHELGSQRGHADLDTIFGVDSAGQYQHIGEFHGGVFECEHVSPWTLSGSNVDACYMVVGQDWSSSKQLEKCPPNTHIINHGFDPKFISNGVLDLLLEKHFRVSRRECYLTNLFPFIKKGNAGAAIPMPHLEWCATNFLLPQIEIVAAPIVICLGKDTFNALMKAIKQQPHGIGAILEFEQSKLCAVAHTGAWGLNNRGMDKVNEDWRKIATLTV
jgi:uracil-DNA glycosylase